MGRGRDRSMEQVQLRPILLRCTMRVPNENGCVPLVVSTSRSFISSFMTYHRVCNQSKTTDGTIGAGTADPSGATEFTPDFQGSFLCSVLKIVVLPFVLFLLAIVLSVLHRFTDFEYSFGIFKLFCIRYNEVKGQIIRKDSFGSITLMFYIIVFAHCLCN